MNTPSSENDRINDLKNSNKNDHEPKTKTKTKTKNKNKNEYENKNKYKQKTKDKSATATEQKTATQAQSKKPRINWNFIPPTPVKPSPYFSWPPNLKATAQWIVNGWLPISERVIILFIAIMASVFFQPSAAESANFSLQWMALLFVRNFVLMTFVAGGLHWYFYIARKQGDDRRYDTKPFATSNKTFTFGSQVHDNMFWTLASGVTVWTLYESLMLWALANNLAPQLAMPHHWYWLALLVFLIPMWETTHFFLIHRLIHWTKIYKRVHALHHRNTNVGPWSGMSMHPIEHVIYLSTILVHFIVPSTPFLITFHLMYYTLSAATTHTGYQGIVRNGQLILPLGTFHHQLHHRFVTCNYGGLEVPLDQWTGSFHDGSDESHTAFLQRRKNSS